MRRLPSAESEAPIPHLVVGEVDGATDWHKALEGCDCVIHLAALAHKPLGSDANAQASLHATNVEGALRLASQAADAGVRRMVFLSSIKAWGEASQAGHPAREDDACHPEDAYGQSKLVAEQALGALASERGLELVIVRSPLVYGPGVKANFAALVRAVGAGWFLPFGAVNNARSLVALDNITATELFGVNLAPAGNQHQRDFVLIGQRNSRIHAVEAHGPHAQQRAPTLLQKRLQALLDHTVPPPDNL